MERLVTDLLGTDERRVVVTTEICACDVAVGHDTRQALGKRQPDRLGDIRHEQPEIAPFHQQDLTTLGRRLRGLDDGVLVALRVDAELALFGRRPAIDGPDPDANLETLDREPDLVGLLQDHSRRVVDRLVGGRRDCRNRSQNCTSDAEHEAPPIESIAFKSAHKPSSWNGCQLIIGPDTIPGRTSQSWPL